MSGNLDKASAQLEARAPRLRQVRAMDEKKPPQDSDPSDMTDFEENATSQELRDALPPEESTRAREERGNRGPDDEPGFGQGA
jgi:hypothetical protein